MERGIFPCEEIAFHQEGRCFPEHLFISSHSCWPELGHGWASGKPWQRRDHDCSPQP